MRPYVDDPDFVLHVGDSLDVLRGLPAESVHCCVTSPPYWGLRDYGVEGQIGLEGTPEEYVAALVAVFAEVRRVLRSDGTCWLNLGDSYARDPGKGGSGTPNGRNNRGEDYPRDKRIERGSGRWGFGNNAAPGLKEKDLCGVPWRVAFALQADGWYLRSDIIWAKPNPMPESVTDRPTKSHEYVFLLSKGPRYFFDQEAVREPAEWARWGDQTYSPEAENIYGQRIKPRTKREIQRMSRTVASVAGRGQSSKGIDGGNVEASHVMQTNPLGRNVRSVWEISTQPYPEAHFAVFPEELPRRCIAAGCPTDGTVLDPFMGSGTTALVARRLGRKSVGIELNPAYAELASRRLQQQSLLA